jgi:RHS repeat-associated protein
MTRATLALSLIFVVVLLPGICLAQVATGVPAFGSFGGGPFDTVNLGNLNVHFAVPIVHKAGRGLPFNYDLVYDNSIWYPTTVSGTTTWTPGSNWGWGNTWSATTGYLTNNSTTTVCNDNQGHPIGATTYVDSFVYHDQWGVSHSFVGQIINNTCPGGPNSIPSFTATATDGSGYTINEGVGAWQIVSRDGVGFNPPSAPPTGPVATTKSDANGNQITSSSGGVFTDTLGTTALTITGASPVSFAYTSPTGSRAYLMHFTAQTIKTAFGCSGIAEYGPTSANLVSDITLPDNSKYVFTYEPTPGFSGDVTGRIASVTLPTGGTITYTYTGGAHGITCSDGSTSGLTRTLTPGGTWTYARTYTGTGTKWTTTVTDPTTAPGNQTVITFQEDSATTNKTNNFYETSRLTYQGTTTGTLLQTSIMCYNGGSVTTPVNCPITSVASPILRKTAFNYLPDSAGKQAETDVSYNSVGLVTEVDEYDFAAGLGAVGPLTRKTLTSYTSLGSPAQVTVEDGTPSIVAQTTYGHDEGTVTSTTGTPQHVAVTSARGNLTSIATQINATQTLYRKFTYYDTGMPKTSTGASLSASTDGPVTTQIYGAGSCGNSFITQTNMPLGISRSFVWNCVGGVLLSSIDESGQTVGTTYNDSNFWRSAKTTDQLNNDTTLSYQSPTTTDTVLAFNGVSSSVHLHAKTDGFARLIINQKLQIPGGSMYDSVETDYDAAGRVASTGQAYAAAVDSLCSGTCPVTTFGYDALDRTILVTDGGGGTVSSTYVSNDVLRTIGPAPAGENTKSKQFEYDALGRLTSVCEITAATGSGACSQSSPQTGYWTKYTYNQLDNLIGVLQNAQAPAASRQARSYTFDWIGRVTSESNPETGSTAYVYDTDATCGTSAGDLVKRTDAAGNVTCYAYDQLHRRISVTYPSGSYSASTPKKYFVYDSATVNGTAMSNTNDRLAEAYTCTTACPGTKITDLGFSYSLRGEVTDVYESTPHSGGYYHVNGTYWAHGALNALSGIPGVPTVYYGAIDGSGLDGEGRYTKVTVSGTSQIPVTGVNYTTSGTTQPIGSLTQVTFGSLDNDNFSYSTTTGRLSQYQFKMGTAPQTDTGALTWNTNGTLAALAITDQINSAENQSCNYTYDDLGRLASKVPATANIACGTAWNQTITLDPFGNASKSATVGTSFQATYTHASTPPDNRIDKIGSLTPTYDTNGNLTNDTAHTYTWDAEGKMLSADGTTAGLTYDAFGRMIEQARGSNYTEILYGPSGRKLALMTGQTLQKAFVQLPGGATAVYMSSGLAYYRHSDWVGNSRLATTPSRTKYYDVAYAPYGESYDGSGTTADVSFTGQNSDTVSWLDDFKFREYNSAQGRWISPDPAGLAAVDPDSPQTWNRFAYVEGNPLSYVDPDGTSDDDVPPPNFDGLQSTHGGGSLADACVAAIASHAFGNIGSGPVSMHDPGSPFEFQFKGFLYGQFFQQTFATWDLYADFRTTVAAYLDDPNNLRLVPQWDDGTDGYAYRNIDYKVELKNGKKPKEIWYVTEHQTNHSVSKPDGMSGGTLPDEFNDELGGIGQRAVQSLQTFTISRTFGLDGQPALPIIVNVPGLGDFGTLGIWVDSGGNRVNGLLRWPGVPFPDFPH